MTTEPKFLTERDDYQICEKPEFIRVRKDQIGNFYVVGHTMVYKIVVKSDGEVICMRRLKTYNGDKK